MSLPLVSKTSFVRLYLFILGILPVAASYPSPTIRRIVVVGGTHGNEYTGVWCIKALEKTRESIASKYPSLEVSTLLANPEAHLENKRFIHSDLNREFSEDKLLGEEGLPLTVESLRAKEVNMILGPKFSNDHQTDLVIDLHSTTSNMGLTVIIPEGDVLMAQAAAHVLHACGGEEAGVRCLMHSIPKREHRPNLSSAAKHGFTIEVGPVPQGVLRHDAVEKTQQVIDALFDFFERRNKKEDMSAYLSKIFPSGRVPCFRSAPAVRPGEMSGKIVWPCDKENPNFPSVMVHKSLQDRDFHVIRTGDPLFVNLDGSVVNYEGSHGDEVYLIFVNEGGYYYESSGTGIGVAVATHFELSQGMLVCSALSQEERR